MTQEELQIRALINVYFRRPATQNKKAFCEYYGVKTYWLDHMIELYGQKIYGPLKEVSKEYERPHKYSERFVKTRQLCKKASTIIADEVSDKEEIKLTDKNEKLVVAFDRTRLSVLVRIVMMDRTESGLRQLREIYKELCND